MRWIFFERERCYSLLTAWAFTSDRMSARVCVMISGLLDGRKGLCACVLNWIL